MIVHEHWSMFTVPMVLFAIDGTVVIIAALNFGVQAGLFALVSLYTSAKTMDSVIKGFNTAMQFLIISARQEEIIRRVHTELDRGCTRLEATGTYEGRKNGALLCVVSRTEASRLKKIVSECDRTRLSPSATCTKRWARDSAIISIRPDFMHKIARNL